MEEEEEPWQPPELPMLAWPVLQARTGLVYDQQMMDHYNLWDRYAVREPGEVGTWGGTLPGRDPPLQTQSPLPQVPPIPPPATTPRCLSASCVSCADWRSWASPGAASLCPPVPPRMLSCLPATGRTPAAGGGGVGWASWGLEPGLASLVHGAAVTHGRDTEGTELPDRPPKYPPTPHCASSAEYVSRIRATEKMRTRELHREGANYDSIYICPGTFACAQLAAGAACRLVEAVLAGEVPPLWGGDLRLQERKFWGWGWGWGKRQL